LGHLYALNRRIGAPDALREIGMKREDLDEAVALCLEAVPEDNPRQPVGEADMRAILEGAFYGGPPESQDPERTPAAERSV